MNRDIFIIVDRSSVPADSRADEKKALNGVFAAIPLGISRTSGANNVFISLMSFCGSFNPAFDIHFRLKENPDTALLRVPGHEEYMNAASPWGPLRAAIDMGLSRSDSWRLREKEYQAPLIIFISNGDFFKPGHKRAFEEKWSSVIKELKLYQKEEALQVKVLALSQSERRCNLTYLSQLTDKGENIVELNPAWDRREIIQALSRLF